MTMPKRKRWQGAKFALICSGLLFLLALFAVSMARTNASSVSSNDNHKPLNEYTDYQYRKLNEITNVVPRKVKEEQFTALLGASHSYSDYVGYHKRDIPSKHSNSSAVLNGNNAPLAGPISYWKAALRHRSRSDDDSDTSTVYLETTDLSDVFFYLSLAYIWLVWLLKSFVKSDWLRYTQDSMLIRGHVLQVKKDDVNEMGIPTYKAVVDYFVGEDEDNKIQIRKEFETQTQLEEGFNKVELLVLSDEPTSSVLKEDWQNQLDEMEQDFIHHQVNYSKWLPSNWWKRVWVVFLAILVIISLAGSMLSACFLPKHIRPLGWWIVVVSMLCLVPVALGLRMILTFLERYFQVNGGIILQQQKPTYGTGILSTNGDESTAKHCDPFAMLDTNACDETEAFSLAHTRQIEMSSTNVDDAAAGCYVIRMAPARMNRDQSNVSDVSSVSVKDAHNPDSGLEQRGSSLLSEYPPST